MTFDSGTQVVTSAGTAEKLTADLDSDAKVRGSTVLTSIVFKAPSANTGNVYVGRVEKDDSTTHVSSSYGMTLEPGDSLTSWNTDDKFENFEVDAAVSGESVEWAVEF